MKSVLSHNDSITDNYENGMNKVDIFCEKDYTNPRTKSKEVF